MELSFREWMIIIGVLLIVAVLLDGYRRVRNERRNRIRVTLSKQARSRAHVPDVVEEKSSGPNPELPNGGARIIPTRATSNTRDDDLHLDEPVPVLMESVHLSPLASAAPIEEPVVVESFSAEHVPAEDFAVVEEDSTAAIEAAQEIEEVAEPQSEPQFARIEPQFEIIDERDIVESKPFADANADAAVARLQQQQSLHTPAFEDSEKPNSSAQEVLIVNVLSKNKDGFKGQDLLQILLACDLRYGNMNIFHRYEKANGKGPVQFSVANLVEPGTFDLDRIDSFSTPGLCFFLTLPGPEKAVTAFNYMIETAQVLVKNLQGELRDEGHSVMTQQTIEHCRQRIRDFERKQLTLHL